MLYKTAYSYFFTYSIILVEFNIASRSTLSWSKIDFIEDIQIHIILYSLYYFQLVYWYKSVNLLHVVDL